MKTFDPYDKNIFGCLKPGLDYSICVGAGVCFNILPAWNELTRRVLNQIFSRTLTIDEFSALHANVGWGLDSLLQAGLNYYLENGKTIDDFNILLQNELYSEILIKAKNENIDNAFKRLISDPFKRDNAQILEVFKFFKDHYSNTSLWKLSDFLIRSVKENIAPKSILNFNADVLLHSLLTLKQLEGEYRKTGKITSTNYHYKALHRIDENDGGKIPIYHLHGSITPLIGKREARQNLVFPETSYTEIAGSTFSWQQNTFQFYSQRGRLIFIGLSMSDPNIRKWIAWSASNLNKEIFNRTNSKVLSQRHIWITTKPKNEAEEEMKTYGLSHLGVRIAYINDWLDLELCLQNLMGIK